jgi:hypothetical protein
MDVDVVLCSIPFSHIQHMVEWKDFNIKKWKNYFLKINFGCFMSYR